jgi:A/G-specific adenine glycosylase
MTRASALRTYPEAVIGWFRNHGRDFPWRRTRNRYEVLISEVLLQRTRGEHAVRIYEEFVSRWPSPEKLARARVSTISRVIRPLGLAKRASRLKLLGRALVAAGGAVPAEPDQLLLLPGVGPYAAHSVPVFAQGANLPVVDWVIARVLRRYFGLEGMRRPNADPELWQLAAKLASRGNARDLWFATLDLGALICKSRPQCPECPLVRSCSYAEALRDRDEL